jgi:hypothetical protein
VGVRRDEVANVLYGLGGHTVSIRV